jgi:hypothetical protein
MGSEPSPPREFEREQRRAVGGVGNGNQIREIGFGGRMREYRRRFAGLEPRLFQYLARTTPDLETCSGSVHEFAHGALQRRGEKLRQRLDDPQLRARELARVIQSRLVAQVYEGSPTCLLDCRSRGSTRGWCKFEATSPPAADEPEQDWKTHAGT